MLAEAVDMKGEKEQRIVTSRYFYICSGKHHGTDRLY